jgi:tellurite methyltransferase
MKDTIAGNIARYRKAQGFTQEELAGRLGVTFQAVSKWETAAAMPDILLLPKLAGALGIGIDRLLGYAVVDDGSSFYEDSYKKDDYFWGIEPNRFCLDVIRLMPPTRRLKLLDIGCGEGKDAVFFARCGYDVSAFDVSEAGLDKTKRLAGQANVRVRVFKANLWDYRLDTEYDILWSSGALHYLKPELRDEIMGNYMAHTSMDGLHAFHVFVKKPFIEPAPEHEAHSYLWRSGELFTYYHEWKIEQCCEYIFDCNSSGVPHRHAANRVFARKPGRSPLQGNGGNPCPSA